MGRLSNKVAVITGAAQGIGAAVAHRFAAEGAQVVVSDMNGPVLERLAAEIGPAALAYPCDVTREDDVRGLIGMAVERFGRLDVAVLNAGVSGPEVPFADYSLEMFEQVMAVNARGVWLGLKHAFAAMGEGGGSIVVTSSTAGFRATANRSAYVASKHASVGLMRAAAIEGAARGIRVNSVNPATIDTPMVQALAAAAGNMDRAKAVSSSIPLGRQGTADEVASMILFLASDESSYCTGGVYAVDGGISAGRPA